MSKTIRVNLGSTADKIVPFHQLTRLREEFHLARKKERSRIAAKMKALRARMQRRFLDLHEKYKEDLILKTALDFRKREREIFQLTRIETFSISKQMAESVLERELRIDHSWITGKISEILDRLLEAQNITVLVNSSEVRKLYEDLVTHHPNTTVSLQVDSNIPSGNARILTQFGSVEICWRKRLKTIAQLFESQQAIPTETDARHC